MIRAIVTFTLIFINFELYAQKKHVVYLTDKSDTTFSISNPIEFLSQRAIDRRNRQNITVKEQDLPVTKLYLDSIESTGATILYPSKWLNAVLVDASQQQMDSINSFGFVISSDFVERPTNSTPINKFEVPLKPSNNSEKRFYGESLTQNEMLSTTAMHTIGFTGEGMHIAVIDNGFSGVDFLQGFQKLRDQNRLLSTYDFVNNEVDVFNDGSHGTLVLSTIGAEIQDRFYGTAFGASYHLFVSENTAAELLDEEFYWVVAAEKADSLGVDLLNTSLGYSTFDNSSLNHSYADLDGETTIISKASKIAASTGMLVVTSAGNAGSGSWHYITTPGDAKDIITVGAVTSSFAKTSFSSVGPTADGRIKPDLTALGEACAVIEPNGDISFANGTSFSSPLICGLAAGFWQAHPNLTNFEVIDYLKQSATKANNPDTLQGWGVPNFEDAHILAGGELSLKNNQKQKVSVYPNPVKNQSDVLIKSNAGIKSVTLLNSLGQIILFDDEINNIIHSISLKNIKKGIYTIELPLSHNQTYFTKLVVK